MPSCSIWSVVAAIPGLLGHFSMTWSLKFVPANIPPVIMLSLPFLSGALAWILLGQTITWVRVAGGGQARGRSPVMPGPWGRPQAAR